MNQFELELKEHLADIEEAYRSWNDNGEKPSVFRGKSSTGEYIFRRSYKSSEQGFVEIQTTLNFKKFKTLEERKQYYSK